MSIAGLATMFGMSPAANRKAPTDGRIELRDLKPPQVTAFLLHHGLEMFARTLEQHEVCGTSLALIDPEDLQELGLYPRPRPTPSIIPGVARTVLATHPPGQPCAEC